jgi:hypothetical protein
MMHVGLLDLRRGTVPRHHQPKEEGLHPRGKDPYPLVKKTTHIIC